MKNGLSRSNTLRSSPPGRARLALAALATTLTGCVSYFSDSLVFQPVTAPPDYGVIYVLRPTSQFGMLQTVTAALDKERWFELYPGTYGALYVKPGKVKLRLGVDAWASAGMFSGGIGGVGFTIITSGAEVDVQSAIVEVDVPSGGAVYVSTSIAGWKEPPDFEVLAAPEGTSDISSLHLTAGGRPHGPAATSQVAAATASPPAHEPPVDKPVDQPPAPAASATSAPTVDPKLDNVYLKDGQIISGTIIAEDAKVLSVMLKEGFGKAIPKDQIGHVDRAKK
jgi:hypothetical protein